ncbi:MAG: ATP-binding protein [Methylococcaceae bacterium]|nr:ATP-binding protein [Methylococcaceae bacterium]
MAIVYFLFAKLAFYSSDFAGNVMAVWPASGIALSAILVFGYRMAFGAGLGSFCYHLTYFIAGADGLLPAASGAGVIAGGSMLEFIVAAYCIRQKFPGLAPETLGDVALFVLIAGFSGAIGACFGIAGLTIGGGLNPVHDLSTGLTWWVGDTTGILIITPLLLVWTRKKSRRGLLFPLIVPCVGLTMLVFFIVRQFEERLLETVHPSTARNEQSTLSNPDDEPDGLISAWLSWNILFGGTALTGMLGIYLESHRREQNALRGSEDRLIRQNRALSRIARSESINSGDLQLTMKTLTETTAATLRVERASIWLFNEARTELYCADLYELSQERHSGGARLATRDYPSYFTALLGARNIAVDDAYSDPVTREFCADYLPAFKITSLLDSPIQFGADLIGVVCHEQVGPKRHWTLDEQNFAGSVADLAALAFEVVKREVAEEALRWANTALESKVKARTAELVELNANLVAEAAERKRTEAILRESELRSRLAMKAADIGIWDWNLADDTVIYSPEWKRQLGYQEDEIGNHYLEWESRLHPDDKEGAVGANLFYIQGKSAEYGTEFRLRHKNGSYRWIYSRGEVVARTGDGKASRILGCHVDITELKQSEQALKAFRWFAESAGQGMGMARLDGEVVYMNPALLRTLEKLGLPADRPSLFTEYYSEAALRTLDSEVLPELLDSGQWTGELELGRANARHIPTLNYFFAVRNEAGQAQYYANIITDLTQQKEMELELLRAKDAAESADRTKSMFIASMSHELRTPLNAIIGFTGILLQGLSGDLNERQTDQLRRVARSARHLLELITDIIDISKIEAGRIDVFPDAFDLRELTAQALDTVRAQARDKDLALNTDVPGRLPVYSDRKRVLQCMINLLSNAVKYTEKGSVLCSARAHENEVIIDVHDTGIGIQPEQLTRLFIPFERLDSYLRLRTSGTGLGLYLTRKIAVDLLCGDVSVVSEPGAGSCFTLRFARRLEADWKDKRALPS